MSSMRLLPLQTARIQNCNVCEGEDGGLVAICYLRGGPLEERWNGGGRCGLARVICAVVRSLSCVAEQAGTFRRHHILPRTQS